MIQPIFIAIAGGSGAGKSTLAHSFADLYPERARVLHLDDYRKEKELIPRHGDFINWDHPDTIHWDQLAQDLAKLKEGRPIVIQKRNERFDAHGLGEDSMSRTVEPTQFILLDGYLALMKPDIREFFNFSIFLDLSHEQRIARRKKFNDTEDDRAYFDAVLIPMHNEFVEPTKKYADVLIQVENATKGDALKQFSDILFERYGY